MRWTTVILAALMIAGCAQQTETGTDTAIKTITTDTTPQQDATPQNTPGANVPAQPARDNPVMADDVKASFRSMFAKKVQYSVTYDMTSKAFSGETTQFFKGTNMRMDSTMSGTESRTYLIGSTFTVCSKDGEWMCLIMAYQKSATDTADEDIQKNIDSYPIEKTGSRMIAGTTTDCYRITRTDGITEYCYSSDFVPLYIKTSTAQGDTELLAKSYSTSVSDEDFKLPAEPTALPDLSRYQ